MARSINAQAREVLKTELTKRGGGPLAGSVQSRDVNAQLTKAKDLKQSHGKKP